MTTLSESTARALRRESLATPWLATRLGVQSARVDALRRSGELLAVRDGGEYLYPAWQFAGGEPLPVVRQLVRTAREAGVDEARLYTLLNTRAGLHDAERMVDLLRNGRREHVFAAVRALGAQPQAV